MIDALPSDIFRQGQVLNNTYEIEGVLGFTTEPEMIHRDNLVLA